MAMTAEEVIRRITAMTATIEDLQATNARLMAGHEQAHRELQQVRDEQARTAQTAQTAHAAAMAAQAAAAPVGGRDRDRGRGLVDPKTMAPPKFAGRGPGSPAWRDWSYEVKQYVSFLDDRLGGWLAEAEVYKAPITQEESEQRGITDHVDKELRRFLVSRTEGEARGLVRGADLCPAVEQWRVLASFYDPLAASRQLDDSRAVMHPTRARNLAELGATVQAWENLERRTRERTGEKVPADMRMSILLEMCPTDLEKELVTQQHLFPSFDALKNHIFNVIHSRTRGPTPMLQALEPTTSEPQDYDAELVEGEDGELYRLERVAGKARWTKVPGKANRSTQRSCYRCGRPGHIRAACTAKTHVDGGPPHALPEKPAGSGRPGGMGGRAGGRRNAAGNLEADEAADVEASLGLIEIGSLEAASSVPECQVCRAQGVYNHLAPPRCSDQSFYPARACASAALHGCRNLTPFGFSQPEVIEFDFPEHYEDPEVDSDDDTDDGYTEEPVLPHCPPCSLSPEDLSEPPGLPSSSFLSSMCSSISTLSPPSSPELGSASGDWGPRAAPEEEDVWELNGLEKTQDKYLLMCAPQGWEEFGEITVDSGAGESVINPRDLPDVALEPSAGSRRGQVYLGPGGERIPNLGQLRTNVLMESGATGQLTFQGAPVRKPLLAVSSVNDKGNMVVFDSSGSFILPGKCPQVAAIRQLVQQAAGAIPLRRKNGVFTMRAWKKGKATEGGFARPVV